MRRLVFIAALLLSCVAIAAPKFPALTGRVVDDAHILSAATIQSLDQKLAEYEAGTSNQIVVVTLPSLQGYSIEDYGYQLGRTWGIGQKGKDNGALLIVAPKEHEVRIEVGYGLEPVLTDAAAGAIVQSVILPEFKAGRMEQGVVDGTQAILDVLGGKRVTTAATPAQQGGGWLTILLIIFFFLFSMRHPYVASALLLSSSRFGSSRLGDSGWSGFSGGGGSFGGGGASGRW